MSYRIKILTPEFKKKVEELISIEVEAALKRKHIPTDRATFAAEFELSQIWDKFYTIWNSPKEYPSYIISYYDEMGVLTPQFSEIIVDLTENSSAIKPRIIWNGKTQKIDDIQEIFSCEKI